MAPRYAEEDVHVDDHDDTQSIDFLHHDDDGESGTFGCAIVKEFRRTVGTWWVKEMTNFNQKTFAVSFFIFFAAVVPAITFGAVYSKSTNDAIGAVEMLVATAWCGIVYALLGGQPIMINGGTGPVLAFSTVLFDIANSFDVKFLTLNAWTGLWVAGLLVLAAFFDLNKMMKHATRFTDEIFSLLIASIFVVEALGSPYSEVGIYWYFTVGHDSHEEFEDEEDYSYMASAFLSGILCIGTTLMAFFLREFKFSPFFPNDMTRTIICDYAVVISIFTWTLIANELFENTEIERLNVPDSSVQLQVCCTSSCMTSYPRDCPAIEPYGRRDPPNLPDWISPTQVCCTYSCMTSYPQDCPDISPYGRRDWLVDLGDVNGKSWIPIFAAIPALLAFILVFLDDGITWRLINHPSHKLTHGEAYNWDTVVIALMIAANSLLGLPWLVAATGRSLTHLNALAERNEGGKVIRVQQTRLTHYFIHALVLCALFALELLKLIPVPVLYGVFLFMGLASLGSNQFFQRILMFFMQPSKYPSEPYTDYMPPARMHKFTLIQIGLFALMLVFCSIKVIAIAFPVVIKACIPIRMYILPKFFSTEELIMIDTDDQVVSEYLAYKEAKGQPLVKRQWDCFAEQAEDEDEQV